MHKSVELVISTHSKDELNWECMPFAGEGRLTIPTKSSSELAIMIGMALRVLSTFESAKNENVMAVLTAPAAVANKPPANKVPTMICCLLGSWRRRMNGIGSNTMRKSVMVLMQPAASKCFCSLMHCCGVTDNVQYASTGLGVGSRQYMGLAVYRVFVIFAYLH